MKAKKKYAGRIERAYESFLELPVPVVVVVMRIAGMVLLGLGAVALYL